MATRIEYSICIPSYDPDLRKSEMVSNLLKDIETCSKGKNYEIIIRKNGPSYVESHNDAMGSARGEWIIVLNDDVKLNDPEWLEKLCQNKNEISSWKMSQFHNGDELLPDVACFAMHRSTYELLGEMDEAYKDGMNYEDTDYLLMAEEKGVQFRDAKVNLAHISYQTYGKYYDSRKGELIAKNAKVFGKKWGLT